MDSTSPGVTGPQAPTRSARRTRAVAHTTSLDATGPPVPVLADPDNTPPDATKAQAPTLSGRRSSPAGLDLVLGPGARPPEQQQRGCVLKGHGQREGQAYAGKT